MEAGFLKLIRRVEKLEREAKKLICQLPDGKRNKEVDMWFTEHEVVFNEQGLNTALEARLKSVERRMLYHFPLYMERANDVWL